MNVLRRSNRTKFWDHVLRPQLDAELLERTIPDKLRSPKQRYHTTEACGRVLKDHGRRMQD